MKINEFRKLSLMLFSLLIIAIFSGCGTVQTNLITSINHYQGGKTLGKDNTQIGYAFGVGQGVSTTVKIEFEEDEPNNVSSYDVEIEKFRMPVVNTFLQFGLLDRFDFIGEGYFSSIGIGGRCNFKYQINDLNSRFGISIMPGIGYSKGITGKTSSSGSYIITPGTFSTSISAASSAFSLEFNVPMSYDITNKVAFHFALNLSKYYYNVFSSYNSSGSSSDSFHESKKFSDIYFNPGFSFGFRFNHAYPEVRIDFIDDDYVVYFGLALKFDKNGDKK